ncbi:MAG: Protein of unknown function (DUF1553)/Protein of unknown function [Planctomycetota bacterium]|nr:Protein of unknown function (DUF1553)/Protein of unknown function [Planctomycetota bacterium]
MSQRPPISGLLVLAFLAITPQITGAGAAPTAIRIEPSALRLIGGSARQQVAVTGNGPNGETLDLTPSARFSIDRPDVAAVSASGLVTPVGDGHAMLHVTVSGQSISAPIDVASSRTGRLASFRLDVAPVFSKAGCNMGACHGNLNGKGGFRLSLRGEDPAFDHLSLTREAFGRRIDPTNPVTSLAILKPTGQVEHEGGRRLLLDSPEFRTLRDWIASGAKDDVAVAPKLNKLLVWPAERYLAPAANGSSPSQQLLVTAEFSDGSTRDVTRQAAYDVNEPTRASVTVDGRVDATGPGEIVVAVRYLGGRGVSRLAFLADRPELAAGDPVGDNPIDRAVFAKLKALRIRPSAPSTDATFLRRAFLDAIGVLPSPDEARAFLRDTDPEKRSKLVDRLVNRAEFADFWALKWADVLRNEEKTMGLKGVWSFQRWLRDRIAADLPMDEFARQIVTAQGSTWQNPPASFHRTNRDPQTAAETIGQVFLGVRLQCARCHNHPFDIWTQDDYYGLAAFFSNVRRREINNIRNDDLDKHEINGDELIYLVGTPNTIQPRSGRKLAPKPPGGPAPDLKGDTNALDDLASWLTRDNPQFARNLANRVWFHLLGRGIVEPVDDFRDSNPPSNPALLDAITSELTASGMRLKPLVARIMKSRTYQIGSTPNATNADDEANFSRASVRLLPAEVLLDALGSALDRPQPFTGVPRATRAVQLPGVKMGGDFLKTFGKPERLLTCECERSESTTLAQAFQLINGESVRKTLTASRNRIGRLIEAKTEDAAILDELYLAALSRPPSDEETQTNLSYVARSGDRRKAWEDVAWATVNSKEFLLRH